MRELGKVRRRRNRLERMLLQRAVAAMEEDRETVRALKEQVSGLEGQLQRVLAAGGGGNGSGNGSGSGGDSDVDGAAIDALRREFAQEMQRLERRLEDRGTVASDAGSDGARTGRATSQRRYPDLVTREPGDDDEQVYGAAWPLIDEWRTLWVGTRRWAGVGVGVKAGADSGVGGGDAGGARLDAAPRRRRRCGAWTATSS